MAPTKKFVPRQRKHKKLAREQAAAAAAAVTDGGEGCPSADVVVTDSNTLEIVPMDAQKRREVDEAKARMRESGTKVSAKKAKRLEKYIETKLRKDESRALVEKLSRAKVDTQLFASTKSLGQGRETKKQAIRRLKREQLAGLLEKEEEDDRPEDRTRLVDPTRPLPSVPKILHEPRKKRALPDTTTDTFASESPSPTQSQAPSQIDPPTKSHPTEEPQKSLGLFGAPALGSGLKRPLETDDQGRPKLQKRQKRGGVDKPKKPMQPLVLMPSMDEEDSGSEGWSGISSGNDDEDEDEDDDEDDGREDEDEDSEGDDDDDDDDDDDSEDEDDGSDDSELEGDSDRDDDNRQRSSAFKAWAQQQRNAALGFEPSSTHASNIEQAPPRPANFRPRAAGEDDEELPRELQTVPLTPTAAATEKTTWERSAYAVDVTRRAAITEVRLKLPVVAEEQRVMEAIYHHDIVVICGATGSGKTTQVPQFLYEAGFGTPDSPYPGLVGITQPRRVAAVSMAKRVAEELGDHGDRVAYQIRFDGTVSDKTAVKFMTDGILMREVAQDIALRKYSAILVDEAHERSVNTDILVGMLSRVVRLRKELAEEDPEKKLKPLKLIIMSATLRISDLTQNPTLFTTPPPVVEVEGRQHPVTTHFSRVTRPNYVEEAFRKICRGHKKLPPGGMLVFLTGQQEIAHLMKLLQARFHKNQKKLSISSSSASSSSSSSKAPGQVRISATEAPLEVEDIELGDRDLVKEDDDFDPLDSDEEDEDGQVDQNSEDKEDEFAVPEEEYTSDMPASWAPTEASSGPLQMQILPLYSLLPTREQMRVFEEPPAGTRQVILATNVAETSITIPGIRYVFDCGRAKERHFHKGSGIQTFEIGWISKASASQRAGRAGRTGPGHCYRLYSSAVYERDFVDYTDPEILRMPIEGVVLQLKAMNLHNVVNFPFPTPPQRSMLVKAEKLLQYLSALTPDAKITTTGTTMSLFPLSPRLARILLVGHLHNCLPYTVALVAGLCVADIFLPESHVLAPKEQEDEKKKKEENDEDKDSIRFRTPANIAEEEIQKKLLRKFRQVHHNFCHLDDRSDAIKLLQVVGEFAHQPTEAWCRQHFVRFKALKECQQLRRQIIDLLRKFVPAFASMSFQDQLPPPTETQVQALKQMVAVGYIDQIAIRADKVPTPPAALLEMRKPRRAIDVPYVPLMPVTRAADTSGADGRGGGGGGGEVDEDANGLVFLHPSSPLAHLSVDECPEYVVYSQLQRSTASRKTSTTAPPKTRMLTLTDISGSSLATIAKNTPLISYGKPIKETANDGTVREVFVVPYLRAESVGGQGWPLPARKVKQKRIPGRGWEVI